MTHSRRPLRPALLGAIVLGIAVLDDFKPLQIWLDKQTKDQPKGW